MSDMKFFRDAEGNCLGAFTEGFAPEGAFAVEVAPISGRQIWNGNAWQWPSGRPDMPSLTARQIRLALINAGLFDTTEAAISGLAPANRVEWEYASEYRREHSLIAELATVLGLTEEQVDTMWLAAATL